MKAVMLSIKPKYCELIASGKKIIEVRKQRPKIETPFKCYIYQSKTVYVSKNKTNEFLKPIQDKRFGKVIGEFVCDTIVTDKTFGHDDLFNAAACLTVEEATAYCTNKKIYGWHISNLVIYDEPKKLSEFRKPLICHRGIQNDNCLGCYDCEIKRPPQSWFYVAEA